MLEIIAFDADDTLWHNEHLYSGTKQKFEEIVSQYKCTENISDTLDELEERNIHNYGYGIKSFTLSMIEAGIVLTNGNISGMDINKILRLSREMMDAEVQIVEGVQETLAELSLEYPLMIITKGDLFEQYRKAMRSGIADYFDYIEVVAEKTIKVYKDLLKKYKIEPVQFMMIGNSLRSDIQPLVRLGAQAIYIPYSTTWEHENEVDEILNKDEYHEVGNVGQVVDLISSIAQRDI